ncbi:MAG TPA: hypothetical protein VK422_03285, partial [Pyrinomonadaceae bacterium]|nr:hypothetical protein [Pyrinomonadaceae bacterium]
MSVPSNFGEDAQARARARETQTAYPSGEAPAGRRRAGRGRTAVEQARLVMLVMPDGILLGREAAVRVDQQGWLATVALPVGR